MNWTLCERIIHERNITAWVIFHENHQKNFHQSLTKWYFVHEWSNDSFIFKMNQNFQNHSQTIEYFSANNFAKYYTHFSSHSRTIQLKKLLKSFTNDFYNCWEKSKNWKYYWSLTLHSKIHINYFRFDTTRTRAFQFDTSQTTKLRYKAY